MRGVTVRRGVYPPAASLRGETIPPPGGMTGLCGGWPPHGPASQNGPPRADRLFGWVGNRGDGGSTSAHEHLIKGGSAEEKPWGRRKHLSA